MYHSFKFEMPYLTYLRCISNIYIDFDIIIHVYYVSFHIHVDVDVLIYKMYCVC
jgi:hypothetical protein